MIYAEYHPPTDLFALMDGVSRWGFNDTAYRDVWMNRFGWSREDAEITRFYRKYRTRNYSKQGRQSDIFMELVAFSSETDPLAEHFINARSIQAALSNLDQIASISDAEKLRKFYEHFRPKWKILLNESKVFSSSADSLNDSLKGAEIEAFITRVSKFYRVEPNVSISVRFVWWPPIGRTLADISGKTVFLRGNPGKHAAKSNWLEIVMHEAIHFISAHQKKEQRVVLSDAFLKVCPVKGSNILHYFEEPMAIAWGQAAFSKYGLKEPLDPFMDWYNHPIPEFLGRMLWLKIDDIYDSKEVINEGFIQYAAKNCDRLLRLK